MGDPGARFSSSMGSGRRGGRLYVAIGKLYASDGGAVGSSGDGSKTGSESSTGVPAAFSAGEVVCNSGGGGGGVRKLLDLEVARFGFDVSLPMTFSN